MICPDCAGSSYSPSAKRFHDEWYGNAPFDPVAYGAVPIAYDNPSLLALAKRSVETAPSFYGTGDPAIRRERQRLYELARGQWCHHLIQADIDALIAEKRLSSTCTAASINAWSIEGMGHDSINAMICIRARCTREGVAFACARCKGTGEVEESKPTATKLVLDYFAAQAAIFDHVGFVEGWKIFPLDDNTDDFWAVDKREDSTCRWSPNRDAIVAWNAEEERLYPEGHGHECYSGEIYTYRGCKKWVYRGAELTLVLVDTHTDGNIVAKIFRTDHEVPW